MDYYVSSVPGDDCRADAVNLLLASMDGNHRFGQTIIDRQPDGWLIPILGSMTAMVMLVLGSLHPDDRSHLLDHFRDDKRDAARLVLAGMADNGPLMESVTDGQPGGCLVHLLEEMTMLLVSLLVSLRPGDREASLDHFRKSCGHDGLMGPVPDPAAKPTRSVGAAARVPANA